MTTTIGIFDSSQDLERAVEQLAAAGFEETVFDEGILAREAGNVARGASGAGDENVILRSIQPNLSPRLDRHRIVQIFRHHLADYHLPEEAIEAYATSFYHNAEFLLVKTDAARAEDAMKILRNCGATRVNRHG